MAEDKSDRQQKHLHDIARLIESAEKLCKRLPQFQRIDWLRKRAENKLSSLAPEHIDRSIIKKRIWQKQKRSVYESAQFLLYEPCWNQIGNFNASVDLKLQELRREHILSDNEAPLWLSNGSLGSTLPSTLRALQTAVQRIKDHSERKQGPALATEKRRRQRQPEEIDFVSVTTLVKQMHAEGCTQSEICDRLGTMPRPPLAKWRHLPWPTALRNPKYRASVKTKLSKMTHQEIPEFPE